jgi:hypothetical protein
MSCGVSHLRKNCYLSDLCVTSQPFNQGVERSRSPAATSFLESLPHLGRCATGLLDGRGLARLI